MPVRQVFRIFCLSVLLFAGALSATAQEYYTISIRNGENRIKEKTLEDDLEFLSGERCNGRKTGTQGNFIAAAMIESRFKALGMKPLGEYYNHSFRISDDLAGHNIAAYFPGSGRGYVVIGAHYDSLGSFDGTIYPGADSNASGVAALLSLCEAIHYMNKLGRTFSKNIILVAFDANQLNMAGSRAFADALAKGEIKDPSSGNVLSAKDISLFVNIDQIGSTLSPLGERPDYLIMLSSNDGAARSALASANREAGTELELGYDYYGSKDFTRLFYYRICDQRAFIDLGIRSVMFTSGITMNNNKPSDTVSTIDFPVLRRRTSLIYYWLTRFIQ